MRSLKLIRAFSPSDGHRQKRGLKLKAGLPVLEEEMPLSWLRSPHELRSSAYDSIWKLFRKMPTFGTLSLQREKRRDAVRAEKRADKLRGAIGALPPSPADLSNFNLIRHNHPEIARNSSLI
ncbi:hypothetical protein Baya_5404 [Bagarius yarrelli]|uniref:Uncharacterized protein n=1 Tax=Bagarius yarrelli TaxID=175774 RepID=A0A556TWN7_BAGYA|nr:hypothetical protein Baya_5404 [Bagarius yarrelli]